MTQLDKIKKLIQDANLTLEQHQHLGLLLRDDVIDGTIDMCQKDYDKTAAERKVSATGIGA